jgi:hypothetical protein
MSKHLLLVSTALITIISCGGGGGSSSPATTNPENPGGGTAGGTTPTLTKTACVSDPNIDSTNIAGTVTRIKSHLNGNPVYNMVNTRQFGDGIVISTDYMVHPSSNGPAKAIIVLLAGGSGDAKLTGTIGLAPLTSSGNFLVRSAHLFAAQSYDVITMDQPSDENPAFGVAYDPYRASTRHAVDISTIVQIVNTNNLPVIISGTSRGTISAVPQHMLASAIALSSPLTSTASTGTPIGHTNSPANLQPGFVTGPVNVSWHRDDTCSVTLPTDSLILTNNLVNATVAADEISGGFNTPSQTNSCKGNTNHGFMGIESCTVKVQTDWIAGVVTNITNDNSRPLATSGTYNTPVTAGIGSVIFDLSNFNAGGSLVTDADVNDTHKFSIPNATTTLGGTVLISEDGSVSYTPPVKAFVTAVTQDKFVYIVKDYDSTGATAKGAVNNNVITIDLLP